MFEPSIVFIGIGVMVLLFWSIFRVFIIAQNKKVQHHREVQQLQEKQHAQLIEAAVRSEEIERHRIAENLHDEVGAILSAAKLHIVCIKEDSLDDRDKELHEKGKKLLDEGIQQVRNISHNLHSSILKEFGLNEAISHFVNQTIKGTLIKAKTELDDGYTSQNSENDISIYRMIQELLNNIMKHSKATEIAVSSTFTNNNLRICILHDGQGLTQQRFEELRYNKDGLGLKNIMNRIILLRGTIEFSQEATGFQTKIDVPITKV
jgi:two-component system NarL family sensor kinase